MTAGATHRRTTHPLPLPFPTKAQATTARYHLHQAPFRRRRSTTRTPQCALLFQWMPKRNASSDQPMQHVIIGDGRDSEDEVVDFANASLYLSAIQTIVSVLACAATAILACWFLPEHMVSAVRTLTLTCLVAAATMRKPLRIGQVHGLNLVFSALRPAVVVYISCLVIETLLHTCTQEADEVPSWRRVVFQTAVVGMLSSGLMRARRPLDKTDTPFLLTVLCLLLVAVLPPPAVSMQGPLCQSVGAAAAAERMVRALVFACVYSLFVYISSPSNTHYGSTAVCIMRASAASVWVLGAALPLLLMAFPQCALAIWSRLRIDEDDVSRQPLFNGSLTPFQSKPRYDQLATRTPPPEAGDLEASDEGALHIGQNGHATHGPSPSGSPHDNSHGNIALHALPHPPQPTTLSRTMGPLSFRQIGNGSTQSSQAATNHAFLSHERMAEIAAAIEDGP